MTTLDLGSIGPLISAIGALGVAAAGLVDASKAFGGGVSNAGFARIERAIRLFLPDLREARSRSGTETNLRTSILPIVRANWINGMATSDQRDAARALIKMELRSDNAETMSQVAEVDPALLKQIAALIETGGSLSDEQKSALGRFDLALASILDAAYQEASQCYRNVSKLAAGVVAVVMGVLGSYIVFQGWSYALEGFGCGILAVPLAPITKDLVSALTAGVQVAQAVRRKK